MFISKSQRVASSLLRSGTRLQPSGQRAKQFHQSASLAARILCSDPIEPVCREVFTARGHSVDEKSKLSEEELCGIIDQYDGLVVRSGTKVTPKVLEAAGKLKIVGRAGTGVDNIDVKAATKNGVLVMNTPGGNTLAAAELSFSTLCALSRNIPAAVASMKLRKWDRKKYTGVELNAKTVAIIGLGNIGRQVAEWAKAFNMRVIGFDPVMSAEDAAKYGIEKLELDQIWPQADFISLHTPLNDGTRGLINDETIAKCKKGVRIVNCARGGVVDEAALLRGLESGHVAGAALDVYSQEPPPESLRPLLTHPKVICTPHIGASTVEAQTKVAEQIAVQICDVFDGKDFFGVLNASHMELASNPDLKPFLSLGESLGSLQAQQVDGGISKVVVYTSGGRDIDITTRKARDALKAAILKGVVANFIENPAEANLINSPSTASELGIEFEFSDQLPVAVPRLGAYRNLLAVSVVSKEGKSSFIAGSVFGTEGKVVQMGDFKEFPIFTPQGTLLSFNNEDRPGAIGEVLKIVSDANLNIASMGVGRQEGTKALAFLILDDEVDEKTLAKLRQLPDLENVKTASL